MTETKNWYEDNPFFYGKDAYDGFVEEMAAASDALPMVFEYHEPEDLTMDDIRQFAQRFMEDTGLNIEFRFDVCLTAEGCTVLWL